MDDIKASLLARMVHILRHPYVAAFEQPAMRARPVSASFDLLSAIDELSEATDFATRAAGGMVANRDGSATVGVKISYGTNWGDRCRDVEQRLAGCLEQPVVYLSDHHRALLERDPAAYVELVDRPESVELLEFTVKDLQHSLEVRLKLAAPPKRNSESIRHVAIDPNLVQLERQLDALRTVVRADDAGPLGPLRALVGLSVPTATHARASSTSVDDPDLGTAAAKLDESQRECVGHARTTPDFAVIKGPPGAGKTTAIASIIEREIARGHRVLVVSPTHVAVDNVVEKLTSTSTTDPLAPHTLPVRHAARDTKLSPAARNYWSGEGERSRNETIARRVQAALSRAEPNIAPFLELPEAKPGRISRAIAAQRRLVCGTPIGILSNPSVRAAGPGEFELLIVDEVSKMTLPEFLAIAVKARRWVLVGDPDQLPPYVDPEEIACTMDDLVPATRELAATVAALYVHVGSVPSRVLVVSREPERAAEAIVERLSLARLRKYVSVGSSSNRRAADVVVCSPLEVTALVPEFEGIPKARLIAERGIDVEAPKWTVKARDRVQARFVEEANREFHVRPWRMQHGLGCGDFDDASLALLATATGHVAEPPARATKLSREALVRRFCVNAVSVYDWLVGLPTLSEAAVLGGVASLNRSALVMAVSSWVGTLAKQYRMHSSISEVPRRLFYFGRALIDGRDTGETENRVRLHVVKGQHADSTDFNQEESSHIARQVADLAMRLGPGVLSKIMVITPYRAQEKLLREDLARALRGVAGATPVEVSTLDRCQGREADVVFISLVRGRASTFLDHPKRWNVALTRAKESMVIVGDIDAYVAEASGALLGARSAARECRISVVALALYQYAMMIQRQQFPIRRRRPATECDPPSL